MAGLTAVDVALLMVGIDVIDPLLQKAFDAVKQAVTTKSVPSANPHGRRGRRSSSAAPVK